MLEITNALHYASGVIAPDYYFINSRVVAELLFQIRSALGMPVSTGEVMPMRA